MEFIKQKAKLVWQIEAYKIKQKGPVNITIAYLLLFSFFYYVPILGKSIWPQHIEDKKSFQLFWSSILPTIYTVVFTLIYLPGYLGMKAYKKYEIQPKIKPNWERENWNQLKWKMAKTLVINCWIIFPLYIYIGVMTAGVGMRFDGFPSHLQIIVNFIGIMIADDFVYMLFHRAFHEVPGLYRFHKMHHEYEKNYTVVYQYLHPFQQVFGVMLPGTIAFMFYRSHIFVFFMWQIYKIYLSIQGHSGYQFPWSFTRVLPLIYGPTYHDFHHSKNVGNYSASIYLFELFFGTNKAFFDRLLADENKVKLK